MLLILEKQEVGMDLISGFDLQRSTETIPKLYTGRCRIESISDAKVWLPVHVVWSWQKQTERKCDWKVVLCRPDPVIGVSAYQS